MKEIFRIVIEHSLSFRRKVAVGPGAAMRRKIQIAFGAEVVERFDRFGKAAHGSGNEHDVRRLMEKHDLGGTLGVVNASDRSKPPVSAKVTDSDFRICKFKPGEPHGILTPISSNTLPIA